MADWAKLIEAIAGLVGAVAWPVAVVLAVWLIMRRQNAAFERLIDRVKTVVFPGGQVDLEQVVAEREQAVGDLVERVVTLNDDNAEQREAALQLKDEAVQLGAAREIAKVHAAIAGASPGSVMEQWAAGRLRYKSDVEMWMEDVAEDRQRRRGSDPH